MQGICEPIATFSLILVAGKETQWQKKLMSVFSLKIRGKSWKFIWERLNVLKCFAHVKKCVYKDLKDSFPYSSALMP